MKDEKVSEESDVDTSSMSDEADEGDLSEGEVFVPKKRSKKETSNQTVSQETVTQDAESILARAEENQGREGQIPAPSTKSKAQKKTKINKVCHMWLRHKCPRGKHCKYLHEKKKRSNRMQSDNQQVGSAEQTGKPKSLYAAVFPRSLPC